MLLGLGALAMNQMELRRYGDKVARLERIHRTITEEVEAEVGDRFFSSRQFTRREAHKWLKTRNRPDLTSRRGSQSNSTRRLRNGLENLSLWSTTFQGS